MTVSPRVWTAALIAAVWSLTPSPAPAHGTAGLVGTTLEIVESEWSLGVDKISVPQGTLKVHVINTGPLYRHDLTIRPKGGGRDVFKTRLLDSNAAIEFSVNLPAGEYQIYCSVPGHLAAGMGATLLVGAAASQKAPAKKKKKGYGYY